MRNRWHHLRPILDYLGLLCWVFAALMAVPVVVWLFFVLAGHGEVAFSCYAIPAAMALGLGLALKRRRVFPELDSRQAMVLCALGWLVISALGAIPFQLGLGISYLDAYFETVSGFTTTGITMLGKLDWRPASILFWRSFIQWLGGLGILTFFLAVLYTGRSAHRLFSAESHKVFSKRPVPSLFRSLQILWLIYTAFTVVITIALLIEGIGLYDASAHAMTALSTGGYSPHDASVGHYAANSAQYPHFVWVEYTLIVGMLLGGINFFVHYRVLTGGVAALWDSLEMRLWWVLLIGATALIVCDHYMKPEAIASTADSVHDVIRHSLFQVVSITTTTGFGTKDIAVETAYFPAASRLLFLLLMVVGGCVGSTGGGIKVLRIGVLLKMAGRQVRRLVYGPAALHPVVVDGERVSVAELRRVAALFFAWMGLLVFGGVVTAMLSNHGPLESVSGMFSALGNIGPCYITVPYMGQLHPAIKVVYILGMLAGRLEILPLLLLLSPRTWR